MPCLFSSPPQACGGELQTLVLVSWCGLVGPELCVAISLSIVYVIRCTNTVASQRSRHVAPADQLSFRAPHLVHLITSEKPTAHRNSETAFGEQEPEVGWLASSLGGAEWTGSVSVWVS